MNLKEFPQFWIYETKPVVLVQLPDTTIAAWTLSATTGEFAMDATYFPKIMLATNAITDQVTRAEFIQHVETRRGEIFAKWGRSPRRISDTLRALYETIVAIEAPMQSRERVLTPEERALIHTLRKQTHELFEAELRETGGTGIPA